MIDNTSNRDPLLHLLGMMDGDGYIEKMEAEGARQVQASTSLPIQGPWEEAESLGIIRGPGSDSDNLFTSATLPEGWEKVPTEHSMWTSIVDERGIVRASIFYKAAFYDRDAFWNLTNVGASIVSDMFYAEPEGSEVALPATWEKLTDEEKAEAAKFAQKWVDDEVDYAGIDQDGTRLPRAERIREMIEGAL